MNVASQCVVAFLAGPGAARFDVKRELATALLLSGSGRRLPVKAWILISTNNEHRSLQFTSLRIHHSTYLARKMRNRAVRDRKRQPILPTCACFPGRRRHDWSKHRDRCHRQEISTSRPVRPAMSDEVGVRSAVIVLIMMPTSRSPAT